MKLIDLIVGVLCGIGLCIVLVWMVNKQAFAQVEAPLPEPPTAYLHDATSLWVANTKAEMQLVRFREGTVCVVAGVYNTSDIQIQCDFSRSSAVQKQ